MKSRDGCEYGEHWSTIWTGGARLQFPTPSEGNSHEPQHWPASGGCEIAREWSFSIMRCTVVVFGLKETRVETGREIRAAAGLVIDV